MGYLGGGGGEVVEVVGEGVEEVGDVGVLVDVDFVEVLGGLKSERWRWTHGGWWLFGGGWRGVGGQSGAGGLTSIATLEVTSESSLFVSFLGVVSFFVSSSIGFSCCSL